MRVRTKLTLAAIDLMRRGGTGSASIAALAARSGVARRSIYLNFPGGKTELLSAATRSAGASLGSTITAAGESSTDPQQQLSRYFEFWREELEKNDFDAACPILAAAVAGPDEPEIVGAAGEVFSDWTARLVPMLTALQLPDDAIDSYATTLIAAIEGAVVMSVAQRSTDPLDHVQAGLATMLRAAALTTP